MNIKELNQLKAPQKCRCENCGKNTICYLQGSITPITRQLAYEEWLAMTPQQQRQFIREKCIASNPSILDLKFGCIIHCQDYKQYPNTYRPYAGKKYNAEQGIDIPQVSDNSGHLMPLDEFYEIIGRKITLADILLAIGTDIWNKENSSSLSILELIVGKYNLIEDDLDRQSDELVGFVCELLHG